MVHNNITYKVKKKINIYTACDIKTNNIERSFFFNVFNMRMEMIRCFIVQLVQGFYCKSTFISKQKIIYDVGCNNRTGHRIFMAITCHLTVGLVVLWLSSLCSCVRCHDYHHYRHYQYHHDHYNHHDHHHHQLLTFDLVASLLMASSSGLPPCIIIIIIITINIIIIIIIIITTIIINMIINYWPLPWWLVS